MKHTLLILALALPACGSAKPRPAESLVTRQSEPMVARPKRMGASRYTPSDSVYEAIEELLMAESDANEMGTATGLRWTDGHDTVAVTHVRFPVDEMTDSTVDNSVDDAVLERCDQEFQGCVDGSENCAEEAYESCIRSAYRDQYVYMSSHLGLDCGVVELSMYVIENQRPVLDDRRPIGELVCDHNLDGLMPAATDLDGDGGPELVYSWSWAQETLARSLLIETLVIVDANSLQEQFRLSRESYEDAEWETQQVTGLGTRDNGDGFYDLEVKKVDMKGFCEGYGWAVDARFVVPDPEEGMEEDTCQVEIEQMVYAYDLAKDIWVDPDSQGSK